MLPAIEPVDEIDALDDAQDEGDAVRGEEQPQPRVEREERRKARRQDAHVGEEEEENELEGDQVGRGRDERGDDALAIAEQEIFDGERALQPIWLQLCRPMPSVHRAF